MVKTSVYDESFRFLHNDVPTMRTQRNKRSNGSSTDTDIDYATKPLTVDILFILTFKYMKNEDKG